MERQSFDKEYVQRLTAGDPETEEHFTAYFGDLLLIKLRSRLRSSQAIEDARQETFLRVLTTLRRKGGLEHPERIGAFVNTVCNNVLFEMYRGSTRATPLEEGTDPPDTRADPEGRLALTEMRQQVRTVLEEIPEKDRLLLKAVFFDERDKAEICQEYQVDRDYLRVLLHRAKGRLRLIMESKMGGGAGSGAGRRPG